MAEQSLNPLLMTSNPFVPASGTGAPAPTGIRVASTLCWLVGLLTLGVAIAVYLPPVNHTSEGLAAFLVMVIAGATVCVAGFLVRRRKKLGAYLVVGAWALPLIWDLAIGAPARPNFLLFAAMVTLLANWKHLQ
jgi:hypothetical protein